MGEHQGPGASTGNRGNKAAPTIYDIARVAGVSPSTVSRALNKPGRINATTEARIRATASSLGYRTNPMARALLTGRTGTIGLVLSDITNPVYFGLVRGVERVASSHDYTLVLTESQESAEIELESSERLIPSVDGLILVGSRLADASIVALSEAKPVVVINRVVDGVPDLVPDIAPGLCAALDHLASLGHRSIAYMAGPHASWMSRHRWNIILDEAPRRGMNVVEIGPGVPTVGGGGDMMRRVVASGVTGVIAYNDLMAIGLLGACRHAGIAVPESLSIIGFDDIFGSDFTTPALTTIRTPLGAVGAEAARRLISRGSGAEADARPALVTEFVLRSSTATPGAG